MPHRFYVITTSGCRSPPVDFECRTDIAAIMHAGGLIGSNTSVEIWDQSRFVGEIGRRFSRWASVHTSGVSLTANEGFPIWGGNKELLSASGSRNRREIQGLADLYLVPQTETEEATNPMPARQADH